MIKRIKSIIYGLRLKYYMGVIQAEMSLMAVRGEVVPDNYIWKRLEKLLYKKPNEPERELDTNKLYIQDEDWN